MILEIGNVHTWTKSSLTTSHITIINIPAHVTHWAPLVLVTDLHTAFTITSSSHQSNVTLSACCTSFMNLIIDAGSEVNIKFSYVKLQAGKLLQHLQSEGSCEQQGGWRHSQSVSVHYHHTPHYQGICFQHLAQMQHSPGPVLLHNYQIIPIEKI